MATLRDALKLSTKPTDDLVDDDRGVLRNHRLQYRPRDVFDKQRCLILGTPEGGRERLSHQIRVILNLSDQVAGRRRSIGQKRRESAKQVVSGGNERLTEMPRPNLKMGN